MEGLLVIRPYPFIGRGDFAAARIDMTEGPTLSPVSMDRDNQRRQLHCEDGADRALPSTTRWYAFGASANVDCGGNENKKLLDI